MKMIRRKSSNISGKCSIKRRNDCQGFDEFGFALTKKKEQKLQHRCHDYSYPQPNSTRVKELCELLSYWNGSSFICENQIERFIRMGIPPSLRGHVWRCLLDTDTLRGTSHFNYQKCLKEVRGPLVDLGVSEYSILSAITTLNETQNEEPLESPHVSAFSSSDVAVFRQIALDLQRSFPTHRSLMGVTPEAIEGQAKLFRILAVYAKYNQQTGYSQGMSYVAAVLLMNLPEEESFWALVALLEKPKYLSGLFDRSLDKIQQLAKAFHQLLKQRRPVLSQHMEDVGVSTLHFVMPWFLTLFTSLPCWDSVLAVWDLIALKGISAVFRVGLVILQLLEPRLLLMTEEALVLPTLLRVPVEVSQHCVLVPALWNTDVQEWEIECMNRLVLEEASGGYLSPPEKTESRVSETPSTLAEELGTNFAGTAAEMVKPAKKEAAGTSAQNVFTRMLRAAKHYLGGSLPLAPHVNPLAYRSSTSVGRGQMRARRRSQRGSFQRSAGRRSRKGAFPSQGGALEDRPDAAVERRSSASVGRAACHRSGSQPMRGKSLRGQRGRSLAPPASSQAWDATQGPQCSREPSAGQRGASEDMRESRLI